MNLLKIYELISSEREWPNEQRKLSHHFNVKCTKLQFADLTHKKKTKWLFLQARNVDFVFYFYGTTSD